MQIRRQKSIARVRENICPRPPPIGPAYPTVMHGLQTTLRARSRENPALSAISNNAFINKFCKKLDFELDIVRHGGTASVDYKQDLKGHSNVYSRFCRCFGIPAKRNSSCRTEGLRADSTPANRLGLQSAHGFKRPAIGCSGLSGAGAAGRMA